MAPAPLAVTGYIPLPAHARAGGFDHADICGALLYVAHTANDAVDVIDLGPELYLRSLPNLPAVAGVLVSAERGLVFTSNRGENSVGIFSPQREQEIVKVPVGVRPNALAYDPQCDVLLAANLGDAARVEGCSLSLIHVAERKMVASIAISSRTRWAMFDPTQEMFFVNLAEPAEIVGIASRTPDRIARRFAVPSSGPHGLGLDVRRQRLFCACDGGQVFSLDTASGAIIAAGELSGSPDVVFFNPQTDELYVAVAKPGCVEVFDTATMRRTQVLPTEAGAKTMAFDQEHQRLYVFLPQSHRAMVLKISSQREP